MITPWTVEAVLAALAKRPDDARIQQALCMGDHAQHCGVCSSRKLFSSCEDCGLEIPPGRWVFSLLYMRDRGFL